MKKLTLALDIGNVCIKIDQQNVFRKLNIPQAPGGMFELSEDFECGRIDEEEFFERFRKLTGEKFSIEFLAAAFDSILIAPVPGMSELVSSMAENGIKPVFFSDISTAHLRRTRELFPAEKAVPDGIYSFVCGARKPSAEMLLGFEKSFGVPDLYVDDRIELIEAARKHGWHAVQFQGAENLSNELNNLLCKRISDD